MRKNILLASVLTFIGVTDTSAMISTKSFCKNQKKEVKLSKQAINNDGRVGQGEYYKGCRHDIDWMEQTREVLCKQKGLISDINIPSYIFFVFDGAADFSARGGERIMDLANLDGSEGNDLNSGNMNGGGFFLDELRDQKAIDQQEMQVHYHASSGFHKRENFSSATGCMRQMDHYLDKLASLDKTVKSPKIVTMGYSNGGVNATKFQKFLGGSVNRPADLAFTLDPIAKTASFLFAQNTKYRGKKHAKTKRFVNLYQDVDHGSFKNLKLRGKPVKSADVNIHVTHDNSPKAIYRDGSIAHLTLMRAHIVKNTFRCELATIANSREAMAETCLKDPFSPDYHEDNL